jgi:hypothetical protein
MKIQMKKIIRMMMKILERKMKILMKSREVKMKKIFRMIENHLQMKQTKIHET